MSSPLVRFDAEGRVLVGPLGKFDAGLNAVQLDATSASASLGVISAVPTPLPGTLSGTEEGDLIQVTLTAGTTYTFDYRGTAGGVEDPYLGLFAADQTTLLREDDDGGFGRNAMITFTPTTTGDYYLYATSFYTIDGESPSVDTGGYTINMWTQGADVNNGTTLANAKAITVGTYYENLEGAADADLFKIEVQAGQVYTFTYNGGVSGQADFNNEPGENIGVLRLFNSGGSQISAVANYETSVSYFAQTSGTIYVQASAYQSNMRGGYTLDVQQIDPATMDPLDSIDWRNADNVPFENVNGVPTAYVYFAPAGENFGEFEDDGVTPLTTYGWEQFQIDGVMSALEQYEHILGVNYEITTDVNEATFRLLTSHSAVYGARFYPQDPAYGDQQGIGTFNLLSGRFTDPASLEQGGFSYAVVLHEFGHAHGLAHPHDTGGGSDIMLGVAGSDSRGIYDLNQGVYTVMSYNDGWETHPDGTRTFTSTTFQSGWSGTLSAFDIAQLQSRYGVHAYNTGNDTYELKDVQAGNFYSTIWDTGGTDSIVYNGSRNAQIDLLAATLDYTPTGGGVVSFVDDLFGGYTIANAVVIENATGGSGNDVLLGNAAANTLTGNAGVDSLMGRAGNDTLIGGAGGDALDGGDGSDTASYRTAAAGVLAYLSTPGVNTGDAAGDSYTSIEHLEGSGYADVLGGNNVANDFFGGDGFDTVSYDWAGAGIVASLGNGTVGFGSGTTQTGAAAGDRYNSIEMLEGTNFNDTLFAAAGGSVLAGLDGNDTLYGLGGVDTLIGGAGQDTLIGDSGADYLYGGDDNDTLRGDAGADYLYGDVGNDTLDGGAGVDVLDGDVGNDTYTGGGAGDFFVIADLGGTDTITDFKRAQGDKIDLSSLAIDEWIGTQAFHNDAGEVRIRNAGSQWWLEGDTNGDGIADFSVAMGNIKLIETDLLFA